MTRVQSTTYSGGEDNGTKRVFSRITGPFARWLGATALRNEEEIQIWVEGAYSPGLLRSASAPNISVTNFSPLPQSRHSSFRYAAAALSTILFVFIVLVTRLVSI
ncbi:hypothetical protein FRB94_013202 [Tulasnella sp. JGI-2019a]|nr:hypothetical protein FRB93_011805 [Tulasnella sp. JGI-2019a]KAG9008478.1 hypothetical protein FRB94_013202 [Tulasnella sp. JGI-2019a]KAG9034785.1 hypothetical protein FRB95_012606 [Tulasnella sp. JGI-2019a]